jgi:preprotein translocase subunit SecF
VESIKQNTRFFEILPSNTNINFIGMIKPAFFASLALVLLSIGILVVQGGPRWGIDFVGGTLVQVRFNSPVTPDRIRSAMAQVDGGGDAAVQRFGEEQGNEFLINIPTSEKGSTPEALTGRITEQFAGIFGTDGFEVRRTEMVGPKVGKELREKGMLAVLFSLLGMLAYIWFRFELRFGLGAIIALAHDVAITLGALAITGAAIDLPIIAALLTVVGYSVNDTIIVCDRIRENRRLMTRQSLPDIVNASINQTLSRTILTSGTTLMAIVALYVFGGAVIHDFAFALLVGVAVGTYSSIFVASPILIIWENLAARRKNPAALKGRAA